MPLLVNEIFTSLQGESSFSGLPCLFIRLTGCNLRCIWCDTKYAYDEGKECSTVEIVNIINASCVPLIEFTGGEPLLQKKEILEVIAGIDPGKTVLLETNGSISLEYIPERVVKIVDVKLKGSGENGSFFEDNIGFLNKKDEIKFVLADIFDYNEMKECCLKYDLCNRFGVLISRVSGSGITDAEIAGNIIRDRLNARYQVQLHKYIWKDEKGR